MYGKDQEIKDGQITNKPKRDIKASIKDNKETRTRDRRQRETVEKLSVPPLELKSKLLLNLLDLLERWNRH